MGLSVLFNGTTNDILANIVSLLKLEQLADLGGTLGTKTKRVDSVSQTGEGAVTLLDNDDVQDGQIVGNNAPTNRSSSTVSRPLGTEAVRVLVEQQSNTLVLHHTLLHGKTLLVVTTGNLEDVALVFLTKGVARDFRSNALVIVEDTELLLVFKFDGLLSSRGGISDIELRKKCHKKTGKKRRKRKEKKGKIKGKRKRF